MKFSVSGNFVKAGCEEITILNRCPEIGWSSDKDETVRKIKIAKHLLLYYRIKKNRLEILDFFDQRQDPDKANY